ncbi:Thaumatin-like protein 1 [Vitis vinifera]|uniref:Thaumatin-like protein 1 n=1 Tax=Vitis vinifera TaxID=29760 RepID=A0A438EK09_VITVI|nr:Thaumatin-like protein 1 [Vitis vinifera]
MEAKALFTLLLLSLLSIDGYSATFNYLNQCVHSVWIAASPGIGVTMPDAPPMPQTGTGQTECQDPPPTYPVTLLQFTIDHSLVSYEVSLNQGYNDAPVRIQPDGGTLVGGSRACPVVDCIQDLSNVCPSTLVAKNKAGWAVGCFSPCDAFKDPKYGCTGSYTGPQCLPNEYSETFKQLCNLAHAYPGDKEPPFYECNGAKAYNITFCPF